MLTATDNRRRIHRILFHRIKPITASQYIIQDDSQSTRIPIFFFKIMRLFKFLLLKFINILKTLIFSNYVPPLTVNYLEDNF